MDPAPGVPWMSKGAPGSTKHALRVWRANIAPKMKKIQKSQRKQGFFDIFSSILMIFEVCVFWEQS